MYILYKIGIAHMHSCQNRNAVVMETVSKNSEPILIKVEFKDAVSKVKVTNVIPFKLSSLLVVLTANQLVIFKVYDVFYIFSPYLVMPYKKYYRIPRVLSRQMMKVIVTEKQG